VKNGRREEREGEGIRRERKGGNPKNWFTPLSVRNPWLQN